MGNNNEPMSYKQARDILGNDFISPEEITQARSGIIYTPEQLAQFGDTMPSQEVLEWCRDNGYMLIAGPNRPMSLLEVRSLKKEYFYSKEDRWYTQQDFSHNDKVEIRWIMVRKESVPHSVSKNWNEQQALLSKDEVTPNVTELVWSVTTYKAVRDIFLFSSVCVRTSSTRSDGCRVYMGDSDLMGLKVYLYWDAYRLGLLGCSSARTCSPSIS